MTPSNGIISASPLSFKLAFEGDAPTDIADINEEILDSVHKYGIKAVLGYSQGGRAVTFAELSRNGLGEDIPEDGRECVKIMTFDFAKEKLFVMSPNSLIPLARLKLTIAYRRENSGAGEEDVYAPFADLKTAPVDDYTSAVFIKLKNE